MFSMIFPKRDSNDTKAPEEREMMSGKRKEERGGPTSKENGMAKNLQRHVHKKGSISYMIIWELRVKHILSHIHCNHRIHLIQTVQHVGTRYGWEAGQKS